MHVFNSILENNTSNGSHQWTKKRSEEFDNFTCIITNLNVCGVKDFFRLSFWVVRKCQDTFSKDSRSHLQLSVVLPCVPSLNITSEAWIGKYQTDSQKTGL